MSETGVVEVQAQPVHSTNSQAELIALTQLFNWYKDRQSLNVYTDPRYAVHIPLSHTVIWKEHGLLKTKGGPITNAGQIMALLKVSHLPKAIGIIHCWSQQTDSSIISGETTRLPGKHLASRRVLQPYVTTSCIAWLHHALRGYVELCGSFLTTVASD